MQNEVSKTIEQLNQVVHILTMVKESYEKMDQLFLEYLDTHEGERERFLLFLKEKEVAKEEELEHGRERNSQEYNPEYEPGTNYDCTRTEVIP